jgi:Tol biopolymer transport system component
MFRHPLIFVLVTATIGLTGCLKREDVQCTQDSNCDLSPGGVCTLAATGNRWCAYPSSNSMCASNMVFTTRAGDGLSGSCVPMGAGSGGSGSSSCTTQIAFQAGPYSPLTPNADIWVSAIDGSSLRNLTNVPTAVNTNPSWSPDGKRLAFTSNRSGTYDVYVVNVDGTNLINLTPSNTTNISAVAWSPDGLHIAFIQPPNVWIMNADGTNAAALSDLPTVGWLAWSPDSKQLAFDVQLPPPVQGSIGPWAIYVASLDHSSAELRITPSSTDSEYRVAWSPATKLVWDNLQDIFIANSDGTSLLNVTQDSARNRAPLLTPNGDTIVFDSSVSGNAELWAVSAHGGTPTPLTHNDIPNPGSYSDGQGDYANSISSDGSLVAFTRTSPGSSEGTLMSSIGVVDVHGLNTKLLSVPGSPYAISPVFSPCAPQSMLSLSESNRRMKTP